MANHDSTRHHSTSQSPSTGENGARTPDTGSSAEAPAPTDLAAPAAGDDDALRGNRRLDLVADDDLAGALVRAYETTLLYAHQMARRAPTEPDRAVHEFRKTLRRLRALLKLMRRALGRNHFRELESRLRAALRGTSARRDADVILDTLDSLALPSGDEALRAQARRALECDSDSDSDILEISAARLLAVQSEELAETVARLGHALPDELSWRDVEDGLIDSFRRARRALKAAVADEKPDAIHRVRKRVKELRYQMELLRRVGGDEFETRRAELARMAEALGRVTDYIMLRRRLGDEGMDREALRPLRRFLRREIRRSFRRVVRERGCLDEKPRRFARRIELALPGYSA